jgi:hypothetical protein
MFVVCLYGLHGIINLLILNLRKYTSHFSNIDFHFLAYFSYYKQALHIAHLEEDKG